ncbi:methyltransferase [Rufibacter sp. LB8]|uniref:methyltransferase n=1 Tax=Rufibacter sp. LB8 TaxID=2777781 RepID=UPI00178C751A|nr:methyltransferase [Rufibacter sp. LB8]
MDSTTDLSEAYWSDRYRQGATQWDAGAITTPLKTYLDQVIDKDLKILVPGGGNGHEAEYLHQQGFKKVYLLDFAPEPLANFKARCPDFPEDHLLEQDFFQKTDLTFDLVLEQTFFCALPRPMRVAYARQVFDLLKPSGKLVGVLFSEEFAAEGPPFGGNAFEYQAYFEPYFHFKHFALCYNSIKPRQGKELFMVLERRDKAAFIA